jgi:hypothetical protein
MTPTIFIVPAGLMGAAGVILAAAGAHAAPGAGLDSAYLAVSCRRASWRDSALAAGCAIATAGAHCPHRLGTRRRLVLW